uniref:HDC02911 n=1 Tax=Drosophila melanogaster TaxID=7227 RepID=Q6IHA6_DROME|nr:TPA_inf: HDC02911 [Drosophila melanogaster]
MLGYTLNPETRVRWIFFCGIFRFSRFSNKASFTGATAAPAQALAVVHRPASLRTLSWSEKREATVETVRMSNKRQWVADSRKCGGSESKPNAVQRRVVQDQNQNQRRYQDQQKDHNHPRHIYWKSETARVSTLREISYFFSL